MSEIASVPPSFLNLDLELESFKDMTTLKQELGSQAFVLSFGPTERGYRLALEPVLNGGLSTDASACTDHFLSLLESLTPQAKVELRHCSVRVFDYGFDGGLEANPIRTDLSSIQLGKMAALGLDVRITTYAYRAAEPEDLSSGEGGVDV